MDKSKINSKPLQQLGDAGMICDWETGICGPAQSKSVESKKTHVSKNSSQHMMYELNEVIDDEEKNN